jgi:uridine phosphorylase
MKNSIPESELILHSDGSVYHLRLLPENLAENVILVGDPGRVQSVAAFFDTIEFEGQHREFVTVTGTIEGIRITVLSTGMGPDNIDIVVNELDALVNIDLKNRKIFEKKRSLNLFRLGTSGAVQSDLPQNAVVVATHGLGLDGMMYFYQLDPNSGSGALRNAFVEHANWNSPLPSPYCFEADPSLLSHFKTAAVYQGITATAPGFYGPQGRTLRLPLAFPEMNEKLASFRYKNLQILNYEMETSALYALGYLLGHRTLSVCLCVANRKNKNMNKDYPQAIEKLIHLLLKKIVTFNI